MFDGPPKREFLSWLAVILWSTLIFVTVPFARAAERYVDGEWRTYLFTYAVAVGAVIAAATGLWLTRHRRSLRSLSVLFGVAGLVVYFTFRLAERSPVEAVHFPQYGFLSLLLFRAFSHRVRNHAVFALSTVAGAMVGMLDETLQWLMPGRHFGMRDVWLNATAAALVQVALAFGIRPRFISGWPDGASLRRLCRLSAVAVAYLGLVHLNTPERVAWYAPYVPFAPDDHEPMIEYGYAHRDGDKLYFRSRLTAEELRTHARQRAEEGARILDAYRDPARYREFLSIYNPATDPFLHEARVHLFGRDVNLELAQSTEYTHEIQTVYYTNAYWENYILEDYFGEVLRASSYVWPAELASEVRSRARLDRFYESRVSQYLIVGVTERQLAGLHLGVFVALISLGAWLGDRRIGGSCPRHEGRTVALAKPDPDGRSEQDV